MSRFSKFPQDSKSKSFLKSLFGEKLTEEQLRNAEIVLLDIEGEDDFIWRFKGKRNE